MKKIYSLFMGALSISSVSQAQNTTTAFTGGSTDASASFEAALSTGSINLGCGTYTLKRTLLANHSIIGAGRDCVVLRFQGVNNDLILLSQTENVTLSGFKLHTVNRPTQGAAIHISKSYSTTIKDVTTYGSPEGFAQIALLDNASNTTKIKDFVFNRATGPCIRITGSGTAQAVVDTFIESGTLVGCQENLFVENGSGIYVSDVDSISSTGSGVRFAVSQGNQVYGVFLKSVLADTSQNAGFSFECGASGCGDITEVHLSNWWSAASGAAPSPNTPPAAKAGILVLNPKVNGLSMVNGSVRGNGGHGIEIVAGSNITIGSGTQVLQNNFSNGLFCGIWIGTMSKIIIIDGVISGAGGVDATPIQANSTNKQRYGICRPTPATGAVPANIIISNSIFIGNQIAGSSFGSSASDKVVVTGNIGI